MTGLFPHKRFTGLLATVLLSALFLALGIGHAQAQTLPPGSVVTNTASATFSGVNGYVYPTVISNTVGTALTGAPVLKITLNATPDPVAPGASQTYAITITNTGNLPATAVAANAVLANVMQFQNASNGGLSSPPAVNWNNLGTIPVGGSITITVAAAPQNGTGSGTRLPFSITVLSAEGASASASITTATGAAPNLVLADSSPSATITPSGLIDYTIRYTNTGNMAATNVVIRNELPTGTALVAGSITGGGMISGRTITWLLPAALPPAASGSIGFKAAVSPVASAGEVISNISSISSTETAVVVSNQLITTVTAAVTHPSLRFAKSAPAGMVAPGSPIDYSLIVENDGDVTVNGIVIEDQLPAGTSFVSADVPSTNSSGTVRLTLGSLAPGAARTVRLTAALDAVFAIGTQIINTATVKSVEAPTKSASVTIVTGTPTHPSLQFAKSAPSAKVYPGGQVTYTFNVRNDGDVKVTGIVIEDPLPAGMSLVSADVPSTSTAGTVQLMLGDLEPGAAITAHLTTAIDATGTAGRTVTNTATLKSVQAAVQTASANVSVANPSLLFAKSVAQDKVAPGGQVTYTFSVKNDGDVKVTGIVIEDPLPAGMSFVSADVPSSSAAGTVRLTLGDLSPGATSQVVLILAVDATGTAGRTITNTASLKSAEAPVRTATATVAIGTPLLSILKTVTTAVARPGNALSYAITLKNEGELPTAGITLRDPLPPGVTFLNADTGGVEQGGTARWTIAALEPGKTMTLRLNTTLDNPITSAAITNTAFVTAIGLGELSATAVKNITPRTPGQIEFIDAVGPTPNKINQFQIGNRICVQVSDADRNTDPALAETVAVTVEHNGKQTSGNALVDDAVSISLTENGDNSGVFQGCFNSDAGPAKPGDTILSLSKNSTIRAVYTDPLDANPVSTASAFIDPFGIVFDSISGVPVANAIVRLIDDATGLDAVLPQPPLVPATQQNPVTTSTDGKFQFQYVSPGSYHLSVAPANAQTSFAFPSLVGDVDLPAGFTILPASRGNSFVLAAGMQPLNLDIPVDPPPGQLQMNKNANKDVAAIGDLVTYTFTLANTGKTIATGIVATDTMPHGIQYLPGSSRIGDRPAPDPQQRPDRGLSWPLPDLSAGASVSVSYKAAVGPDSQRGNGRNSVRAEGVSVGRQISSNTAVKTVKLNGGVFTSDGTVIGRVARAVSKVQHGASTGNGVSGVSLYMEDGTRVVTDVDGKYSISGIRPGTHLLRLDETTLPKGFKPVSGSNRFMGADSSQFVDMTAGGLFKANFEVESMPDSLAPTESARQEPPYRKDSEAKERLPESETPGASSPAQQPDLEKDILAMTPQLEFLNLRDGIQVQSSQLKFMIKSPAGASLVVTVNGREVPVGRIGRKISAKAVFLYEYVNVPLEPGEKNRIRAELKDAGGRVLEAAEVTVLAADTAARIEVIPAAKEAPADGAATVKVTARIMDRNGMVLHYPEMATVASSAGEIVEPDADPATAGLQVPCRQGVAEFTIKAPYETAEARVTVGYNGVEQDATIFFAPNIRRMLVVGLGEATLGYGSTSGKYSLYRQESDRDKGFHAWGKGAFFLKGELTDGIVLTASFDSDKKKQQDFFRNSVKNPEAEDRYQIYGDESRTGYEALSREKGYVKFEKGHSYAMYGDYETGLTGTRLGQYTRTLTGLKSDISLDYLKVTAFASDADVSQVVDNIPARGISGFYQLGKTAVEGSERVVVETRDRQRIERVLNREIMARWSDYTIDYDLGTILFKSAVPSHDANMNPVYIIVTYETRGGGGRYPIFGGRGVVKPTGWLEAGATGVAEQKATNDYHLLGADITLKLPGKTTIKAEVAQTDSAFDIDSAIFRKKGTGWGVELESAPLPRLLFSGYYRYISSYFDNQSATDSMRGTRKYGVEAKYGVDQTLQFKGRYFEEHDLLNTTSHTLGSFGFEKSFGKAKFGADLLRETSTDRYVPATSATTRTPFDISAETAREMAALRVGGETPLFGGLSLTLSHLQDLQYNRHNLSQVGLNYQIAPGHRLYVREEFAKYQERTESRTVFGGESQIGRNTVAYNEYRIASGADGNRSQEAIGLRNKFMLGKSITGNLNIEKLITMKGNERNSEPDAFAAAGGIEYLALANFKITSRLEYRQEISARSQESWLGELMTSFKLRQDYSLILGQRYFLNDIKREGQRITSRTFAGLAYRPQEHDRLNVLGKVELKHEENDIAPQHDVSTAYIMSVEGIFQAAPGVQLIAKYAGKAIAESGFSSYTDLYSGRILYDLTRRIDLGGEYRLLTNHATHITRQGGALEAGCRAVENVWLSLGYSFDRFDADLAGDRYTGEGPYIRMRVKFDENSLQKLRNRQSSE